MLEEQNPKELLNSLEFQVSRIIDMCLSSTSPSVELIAEIDRSIAVAAELESLIDSNHLDQNP